MPLNSLQIIFNHNCTHYISRILDSLNIEFIGILILTERASERSCVPTSEGRHITKYGSKTCGKFGVGGCNCGYETPLTPPSQEESVSSWIETGRYADIGSSRAIRHRVGLGYTVATCQAACSNNSYK